MQFSLPEVKFSFFIGGKYDQIHLTQKKTPVSNFWKRVFFNFFEIFDSYRQYFLADGDTKQLCVARAIIDTKNAAYR